MCVDAWRTGVSICGTGQEVRLIDLLKFLDLNSSASVIMTADDVFNGLWPPSMLVGCWWEQWNPRALCEPGTDQKQ